MEVTVTQLVSTSPLYLNTTANHSDHKSPQLGAILIPCNTILPSTLRSPKWQCVQRFYKSMAFGNLDGTVLVPGVTCMGGLKGQHQHHAINSITLARMPSQQLRPAEAKERTGGAAGLRTPRLSILKMRFYTTSNQNVSEYN